MRIVFVGSPPFANPVLERLATSPFAPVLVVTPPDRPRGRSRAKLVPNELAELARERGIGVLQPATVRDEDALAAIRAREPEVVLVAAYGEYLNAEFRALPSREILNVHPSLLPRHRGASPIPAAIAAGDERTGVSVQRVVKEMDAGDVVVALETDIAPGETAGELALRLAELGGEAALRALEALDRGDAQFEPQDPARVTTCTKLGTELATIDWSAPAREVVDLVRAMNPWPVARTLLPGGQTLQVLRARAAEHAGSPAPGTFTAEGGTPRVRAGDGWVELVEVKPAGKRALAAGDWLRGARLEDGLQLGVEPEGTSDGV